MDPTRWQLDDDAAELYQRYSRYMLKPWVPALLDAVGLQAGERVLDVACGTGFVTTPAAGRVGRSQTVTGVDINIGMLEIARATSSGDDAAAVEWVEASVKDLPFPDGRYDVVLCQQGLQFFPDRPAALREMHRVLAASGRLGVSAWGSMEENPYFAIIERAVRKHVSDDAAFGLHQPHALADPRELRDLVVEAGFRNVQVQSVSLHVTTPPAASFLPGHLFAMPVAGAVAALSGEARKALTEDLHENLAPYDGPAGMRLPCKVYVATACR